MRYALAFAIPVITVTLIVWVVRRFVMQQRSLARLYHADEREAVSQTEASVVDMSFVRRWLFLAGFRDRSVELMFWMATIACTLLGLALLLIYLISGLKALLEEAVAIVPGGVGEAFLPVVWVSPWLLLIGAAAIPTLFVRFTRRKRVELIEQDLPISLEMLATLSEAGLGFDAALARILNTRLASRPLAGELHSFQADLLAGRSRVESLRRFAHRINIPTVSIFISALVQAELLGMGTARVLRQQANDMRSRRRERAAAFANALPVKRLFPLVICFLPGLFIWTLGPAFVQLFKMAEAFINVNNF